MTDLLALAERVEALQGPDNSVDVLVAVAIFEPSECNRACRANAAGTKVIFTDIDGDDYTCWPSDYTGSIDVAFRLLPKDWRASFSGCNDSWHVALNNTWSGPLSQAFGFARSAALALTAAALRARASTTPENPSHQESDRD